MIENKANKVTKNVLTGFGTNAIFVTVMGALKSPKCSKGHLLKGDNLYMRKNGQRECKTCSNKRAKEFKEKAATA